MALERDIDPLLAAEWAKPFFHPIVLVRIDWPEDPVFAHSNRGEVSFDGELWQSAFGVGQLRLPEQTEGPSQRIAEIKLVGVPDDLQSYMTDEVRGVAVKIYLGAVTQRAGNVLIGTPVEFFSGKIEGRGQDVEKQGKDRVRAVRIRATTGPSQKSFGQNLITLSSRQGAFPEDSLLRHAASIEQALRSGSLNR